MIEASTGHSRHLGRSARRDQPCRAALANVRASSPGHAHYDHLLDAPAVLGVAPQRHALLERLRAQRPRGVRARSRSEVRRSGGSAKTIARSRVVAVDDPAASMVDYTNCPEKRPAGAPLQGTWVKVPGSHVRSSRSAPTIPIRSAPFTTAPATSTDEQCTPPTNMNDWHEGHTVAYVVDFLDPKTDAPIYRVFYQDAPADSPVGHVPAAFLADKRVDVALMCVGTYDHVDDASPAKALTALGPRYALGGHWEDFFGSLDAPPQPIPFLDVAGGATKAVTALPPDADAPPMLQNGKAVRTARPSRSRATRSSSADHAERRARSCGSSSCRATSGPTGTIRCGFTVVWLQ